MVAETPEEAREAVHDFMESATLGAAGSHLVIEEFLEGEEASFHVFADGTDFQSMVAFSGPQAAVRPRHGTEYWGYGSLFRR